MSNQQCSDLPSSDTIAEGLRPNLRQYFLSLFFAVLAAHMFSPLLTYVSPNVLSLPKSQVLSVLGLQENWGMFVEKPYIRDLGLKLIIISSDGKSRYRDPILPGFRAGPANLREMLFFLYRIRKLALGNRKAFSSYLQSVCASIEKNEGEKPAEVILQMFIYRVETLLPKSHPDRPRDMPKAKRRLFRESCR